jgi:hypothetical protein
MRLEGPDGQALGLDVGDLVLLRSPRSESSRKLESKWAGPYVVVEKPRPGAFRLLDFKGRMLEYSKNVENLRQFFCLNQTCNRRSHEL